MTPMRDDLLLTTAADLDAQRRERREALEAARDRFPDETALARGLASVLRNEDGRHGFAALTGRERNPYESTFPSEVVACRLDDGSELRLLCKYGVSFGRPSHSSRGSTAFESVVYRKVLQPLEASSPAYYGDYTDPTSGETCLVIEYVDGLRLSKAPQDAVLEAARWIGRLHAAADGLASNVSADLHVYGAQYYLGWAERTAIYTRQVRPDLEWVPAVCERFSDLVPDLLAASQTVIHGEYYPKNILVRGQRICPVDWQSAAIAAGEVDLASLTEGHWPEDLVPRCESAYAGARWPGGPPASFERSLAAARLYWPLRWLGERPERTAGKRRGYFDVLLAAAQRLGLASGGAQWLR